MKRISSAVFGMGAAIVLMGGLTPAVSNAASEDECAIWLCLPGGFPSGCGDAKDAMKDRLEDFKPPLPNFSSCAVSAPGGGGSTMSHDFDFAAYVPEREVCEMVDDGWGLGGKKRVCETIPEHYVDGRRCQWSASLGSVEHNNPPGCTTTFRYIDVFVDGQRAGERYYWNRWN